MPGGREESRVQGVTQTAERMLTSYASSRSGVKSGMEEANEEMQKSKEAATKIDGGGEARKSSGNGRSGQGGSKSAGSDEASLGSGVNS